MHGVTCPARAYFSLLPLKEKYGKRKRGFFQMAPPGKNSSTLLTQIASQRYGAGFLPIINFD
jgi:hypothetical protein